MVKVLGLRGGGARAVGGVRGGAGARVQGKVVNVSGPQRNEEAHEPLAVYKEAHAPGFKARW